MFLLECDQSNLENTHASSGGGGMMFGKAINSSNTFDDNAVGFSMIHDEEKEPWKILIYDKSCKDIIASLFNVNTLQKYGITLYLLCIHLHTKLTHSLFFVCVCNFLFFCFVFFSNHLNEYSKVPIITT